MKTSIESEIARGLAAKAPGNAWQAAQQIAKHGHLAVRRAADMLRSSDSNIREFGALILGYVDPRETALCAIAAGELTAALETQEPALVAQAALSLARLPNADVVKRLMYLRYVVQDGVRLASAIALIPFGEEGVKGLIALSADPDPEIRSWAIFGLSQLELADEVVRDALRAAADDSDADVRGEALVALAEHRDDAFERLLFREMKHTNAPAWIAAACLAWPQHRFIGPLRRIRDALTPEQHGLWARRFDIAIDTCEAQSDSSG
ncbi:MAG: HEAT repeat domain-containing protein [Sandaracinaceae bacterium]